MPSLASRRDRISLMRALICSMMGKEPSSCAVINMGLGLGHHHSGIPILPIGGVGRVVGGPRRGGGDGAGRGGGGGGVT